MRCWRAAEPHAVAGRFGLAAAVHLTGALVLPQATPVKVTPAKAAEGAQLCQRVSKAVHHHSPW
jgi:hypothetical protein